MGLRDFVLERVSKSSGGYLPIVRDGPGADRTGLR